MIDTNMRAKVILARLLSIFDIKEISIMILSYESSFKK